MTKGPSTPGSAPRHPSTRPAADGTWPLRPRNRAVLRPSRPSKMASDSMAVLRPRSVVVGKIRPHKTVTEQGWFEGAVRHPRETARARVKWGSSYGAVYTGHFRPLPRSYRQPCYGGNSIFFWDSIGGQKEPYACLSQTVKKPSQTDKHRLRCVLN